MCLRPRGRDRVPSHGQRASPSKAGTSTRRVDRLARLFTLDSGEAARGFKRGRVASFIAKDRDLLKGATALPLGQTQRKMRQVSLDSNRRNAGRPSQYRRTSFFESCTFEQLGPAIPTARQPEIVYKRGPLRQVCGWDQPGCGQARLGRGLVPNLVT